MYQISRHMTSHYDNMCNAYIAVDIWLHSPVSSHSFDSHVQLCNAFKSTYLCIVYDMLSIKYLFGHSKYNGSTSFIFDIVTPGSMKNGSIIFICMQASMFTDQFIMNTWWHHQLEFRQKYVICQSLDEYCKIQYEWCAWQYSYWQSIDIRLMQRLPGYILACQFEKFIQIGWPVYII